MQMTLLFYKALDPDNLFPLRTASLKSIYRWLYHIHDKTEVLIIGQK